MSNPDPNAVAAGVISELIKSAFDRTCTGIADAATNTFKKIFEDFSPYMEDCFRRNRYVRVLCNGDADVDFEEVYVGSFFQSANVTYSDADLICRATEGQNLIINGNGGAGKTFFMRRLWLDMFKESPKVPVFIELRRLNTTGNVELFAFLKSTISTKGALSDSVFSTFCENGRFAFILDGFDEVVEEKQSWMQEQIILMSEKYTNCSFVVSSRFDSRFAGWQSFTLMEALPFTIDQVKSVCERVPFDKKFKTLFLKRIDDNFFNENRSFLSNPLLAVMMMMTFKDNMDIPKKMAIFYDQAFNTLFQFHDSTKAFKRAKLLDIQQFRRSFGIFCLLSYYSEMFEFSKSQIIEKIIQSNKVNGFDFDAERVLADYEKSVNLIKQDGLNYVFIHRSFQEYFAAVALTSMVPEKLKDVSTALIRRPADNVLKMCYDLQRSLVIKDFIEPHFAAIKSVICAPCDATELLAAMGAEVKFYIPERRRPDKRQKNLKGLGIIDGLGAMMSLSSEFNNFITAVAKIRGTHAGLGSYAMHSFFKSSVFEAASKFIEHAKIPGPAELCITFSPAGFIAEVTSQTTKRGRTKIDLSEEVKAQLTKCAQAMQSDLAVIATWCEQEIYTDKFRDLSLDEMFGLSRQQA